MTLRGMTLPRLPRLPLAAFRSRLIFRGVFLLLMLATLALALTVLGQEKQRGRQGYEAAFRPTLDALTAELRHPRGQLALLNLGLQPAPAAAAAAPRGIRPSVLPFAAIDFDDPFKARQAVELSGCALGWPRGAQAGAQVCVAIGRSAFAGGFVYVVVDAALPPTLVRERGVRDLQGLHRARVVVSQPAGTQVWTAPFEAAADAPAQTAAGGLRGRLTGFAGDLGELPLRARPERDFRGWLWQERECAPGAEPADTATCARRTLLTLRLPVAAWREALYRAASPQWPPADLPLTEVKVQWLGPDEAVLFDASLPGAEPPFALEVLSARLREGETLRLVPERADLPVRELRGPVAQDQAADWLQTLILRLPVPHGAASALAPPRAEDIVVTPAGRWRVELLGDFGAIDRQLGVTATRLAGYVGAMLLALGLAWLLIELLLMRRVAVLTQRAAALGRRLQERAGAPGAEDGFEGIEPALRIDALRGRDELGILAGTLADLLQRVREAARREQAQALREREMWHAVGHEIMSPLQSLMVLHRDPTDASHRYVRRMQQAVRVLYGEASPGEAISAAALSPATVELDAFLRHVAHNAAFVGLQEVVYPGTGRPTPVRADEYALEDVLTHLLRNADRHRRPGTPVTLSMEGPDGAGRVRVGVHNIGPAIPPEQVERIFDYGFRGDAATPDAAQRGQGLFVARSYLGKMGGTLTVEATEDGPRFVMTLVSAPPGADLRDA